jgi:drug/metabolite transporter (DMT)-like permease
VKRGAAPLAEVFQTMAYANLILAIALTASAQILVKLASAAELRSSKWMSLIASSLLVYGIAFIVYSSAVRTFPITVAGPVSTIAVMVIVCIAGVCLGEVMTMKQCLGILFGLVAVVLLVK